MNPMNYLKKLLIPGLCLLGASPVAVRAATITITATADAMIRSDFPTTNYGSDVGGFIGTVSGGADLRQIFSFDLSALFDLGQNIQIEAVTLALTQRSPDATSVDKSVSLSLYSLTQAFTEGSVTWSTSDGSTAWTAGGTLGTELSSTSASTKAALGTAIIFGSSSALVNEVNLALSLPSNSLSLAVLAPAQESLTDRALISTFLSEHATEGYWPVLNITYGVIPEPSTYALLLGVVCLLAVTRKRMASRLE